MRTLLAFTVLLGSVLSLSAAEEPQHAPSAALAKKCRELAVKAYPPAVAGSRTGTAAEERQYFLDCIKKGGEMGDEGGTKPK